MAREIVFDTETTGFKYSDGDRLIEIGAVELMDHLPTGKTYHQYINPERDVPEEAVKVHGLTYEKLKNYPTFDKIADDWLSFVGDSKIIAHNASFDMNFLNYELKQINKPEMKWENCIDTLEIARGLFPGARCSLDALCKRFNIDNSARTYHGALLDAELLSEVYLELIGGKEPTFLLNQQKKKHVLESSEPKKAREPREFSLNENIDEEHAKFLEKFVKNPLWIQ